MSATNPTHADMSRELGRLQGEMSAVKDGLDRIEKSVEAGFSRIDDRLRQLEAKENQRKGALALLMVLSGIVGGALVKVVSLMMGAN